MIIQRFEDPEEIEKKKYAFLSCNPGITTLVYEYEIKKRDERSEVQTQEIQHFLKKKNSAF